MNRYRLFALALSPLLPVLAGPALAQINSSPPALMGQPSFHVYSVTDVINGGGLATFFSCTNTTSANIRVGVEVFAFGGGGPANDPSATSLDILPGGTNRFGTSSAFGISTFSVLSPGPISQGSARILATAGSGIICNAFVADVSNAPPTSMAQLTIVKKIKQKGD